MPEPKQELVEANQGNLPSVETSQSMQLLEAAMSNPEIDVDKMERIMAMQERVIDKASEQAFNRAMNRAQEKVQAIAPDQRNGSTDSNYASYAQLDRALRPIYLEEGFSLSFDTAESPNEDSIMVLCYCSHVEGHTRTYRAEIDASGKGAKGGAVMTKTHASGSAMSYGMRYLLKMIFNVAIGETDDDGNAAGADLLEDKQVKELEKLYKKLSDGTRGRFDTWLAAKGIAEFSDLPAGGYKGVKKVLQDHINADS